MISLSLNYCFGGRNFRRKNSSVTLKTKFYRQIRVFTLIPRFFITQAPGYTYFLGWGVT